MAAENGKARFAIIGVGNCASSLIQGLELDRDRLESKKISKTKAVTSQLPYTLDEGDIHVGPSDCVEWLTDRKWCNIRMEGRAFGEVPPQHRAQAGSLGFAQFGWGRD